MNCSHKDIYNKTYSTQYHKKGVKRMINKDNWEQTKSRYIEFWNRENHDRPIISVTAPLEGYKKKDIKPPEKLIDRWLDIDYVIASSRENFRSTYFGGEAFPHIFANLGPDILGAFLGCDLEFGETTSWAKHYVSSWEEVDIKFDPQNKWWAKIVQMTEAIAEDAKNGDYLAGITDLHPGLDGLTSLRGPENLCFDLVEIPETIKNMNNKIFDVYKTVLDELYRITTKYQHGSTHWMGIWHPGKWYSTSCDFMCMISKEMVSEFVIPEIKEELKILDASIFHLDGPGALKHLDLLLELPDLKGIQWVYGAGQPSASHWIPVLKKIQQAGKLIQVNILPEELQTLLSELQPEGVMYCTCCSTEQDARDLIKIAEKSYKK